MRKKAKKAKGRKWRGLSIERQQVRNAVIVVRGVKWRGFERHSRIEWKKRNQGRVCLSLSLRNPSSSKLKNFLGHPESMREREALCHTVML